MTNRVYVSPYDGSRAVLSVEADDLPATIRVIRRGSPCPELYLFDAGVDAFAWLAFHGYRRSLEVVR